MGIIYLITLLILLISVILVKKSDNTINVISFICLGIIGIFCYNALTCYILTFFLIPIKLWLLSIINVIFIFIFIFKICRNKEIQKYSFNKIDIISVILIAIIVLIVSYLNFGTTFNVKYESSDASIHYISAIKFAESESLLASADGDPVYGKLTTMKIASYVNSGLLMKCICPNLDTFSCYNIFVSFEIFVLFLIGLTLYSAMGSFAKRKEHKIWALAISIICMLGYPLNSLLFGFEYLTMGLLMICAIFCLIYHYDNKLLDKKYLIFYMMLFNFGLFTSYYMFVPFMYPALWIYFYIKNYRETNKIITKELLELWLITLLLPFFLGYIYHIEPNMYSVLINKFSDTVSMGNYGYALNLVDKGLPTNGYIYINLYSNILLLMPLPIYMFIKEFKDKKLRENTFIGLALLFCLSFIIILLIFNKFEKVSMYYLSKNYFALWIILAYCNFKALLLIDKKKNILPRIFITTYISLIIICTIFSNVEVKYWIHNIKETPLSVTEIFGANKTIIKDKEICFYKDELDILKYARNNLDYSKQIELVVDRQQGYWAYALLRYINYEEVMEEFRGHDKIDIKRACLEKNIGNVDYIIYFNRNERYNELKDKLFENADIIYENSAGGILCYKNN